MFKKLEKSFHFSSLNCAHISLILVRTLLGESIFVNFRFPRETFMVGLEVFR